MNKHKYYRITETKDNSGNCTFEVQACNNFLELCFGCWDKYAKTHKNLSDAINHMNYLVSQKIITKKIVYRKKLKSNKPV